MCTSKISSSILVVLRSVCPDEPSAHSRTQEGDSPVLRLDPAGQPLPDVHRKIIIVQIVHMFQESDLQLLNLLPLAHAAVRTDATIHTKLEKQSRQHVIYSPSLNINHSSPL